jgi:serine/threonine-protein kinase
MADDELPFRFIPPPDPNLGRRVDTYFILRFLLGKGGMGAAYLAEHEALAHVKCVIKLVLVEMTRHPMIISRYHNEAKALALLRHDNIVKLQGLGVLDDGQLYLRFEYVEGKSLDRYLAEHSGRLPLRKAVNFVFQLCWALQHAHDRGVIHRDLKPDNVMIEVAPPGSHVKERVKILDFGIAKVVSGAADVTGSGMQMGTPTYMAPEQVTNAASVDGRADVFSLAQVLYKMVTGSLPWGNPESTAEIYHRQRTRSPEVPPSDLMPPEVVELVFRALSLNPDDRPTAHEFAIELASRLKYGTELLGKVVPEWAETIPHTATTLPRPAEPTPPSARSSLADASDLGAGRWSSSHGASRSPEAPPPAQVKDVTAPARPRAPATPSYPAPVPAPRSSGVALNTPATPPLTPVFPPPYVPFEAPPYVPSTPVIAALPTGLASQQFAAQELPVELRAPQAEVSSEIELATGTPGPLPYAHADLPAVLVSQTQLPGLTSQSRGPGVSSPEHREPPPFVVLPAGSNAAAQRVRSVRSRVVLIGAACTLAAIGAFAISRLGSHATAVDEHRSAVIPNNVAPSRTTVAGTVPDARTSTEHAALVPGGSTGTVGSPPVEGPDTRRETKAGEPAATATPSVSSANTPTPGTSASAAIAPRAGHNAAEETDAIAAAAASHVKPAAIAPGPGRVPSPRTPQGQKPLRARQAEARSTGAKTGNLHLLVTPWAVCSVDGERIDQTPCMLDDVPVGRYRVRLENNVMHKVETLTATVTSGETTTIERAW